MTQHILSSNPFRCPVSVRRALLRNSLRALPLVLLNGALVQVASAQSTGAAQTAQPSALYSLVSTLSVFTFLALLVGAVRPKTFAFLFKEKATRGRVCGSFGAAWFFLVILAGPLRPRPVATAPTTTSTTTVAQSVPSKSSDAVRVAENRAKAAEARVERAEKAAASANASANAKSSTKASKRAEALRAQVNKDLGIPDSLSQPQTAPEGEKLPSNVSEVDVEGVGKRQIGEVDGVLYSVVQMERAQSVGGEGFSKSADGVFYVLRMRAFNTEKKSHSVRTRGMKLVDDQGREFDPSSEGALALKMAGEKSAEAFSAQLQPGVTKKLTLVYDAPSDANGLKLKIPAGGFGFGKSATLKVPTASE